MSGEPLDPRRTEVQGGAGEAPAPLGVDSMHGDTLDAGAPLASKRPSIPGHELQPGTLLDGTYRVVRRIGGGGMGAVYLVEHAKLGRRFAAKVVTASRASDPDVIERLRNEARVASSIQHDNIVDVTHLGQMDDGSLFVVMELLEGYDLRHRFDAQQSAPQCWLPDDETRRIAADVLRGLHAAHEANVVHRDLKPDNIFLVVKGGTTRAKIVDFGISKVQNAENDVRLTRTGQIVGTPLYMSPEQTRGVESVDRRADVYAMGVILYEALTGRLPFDATTVFDLIVKHATEKPTPLTAHRPDLPPAVSEVVLRCMGKKPEERFATAVELADAFEAAWTAPLPTVSAAPPASAGGVTAAAGLPPSEMPATARSSSTSTERAGSPASSPESTAGNASSAPPRGRGLLVGGVVAALFVVAAIVFATRTPEFAQVPPAPPAAPLAPDAPPSTAPVALPAPAPAPSPPPVAPVAVDAGVAAAADVVRRVESVPVGAEVFAGGTVLGVTPLDVTLPGGAAREIVVRAGGRRPETRTLTATDEPVVRITLEAVRRERPEALPSLPSLAPR